MCALLVAINPFVAYYASETRMYAMAVLLALLATATFLHAFVLGRRRYLPWFVVCQTLLMYTHNWGLLMGVGAAVAVVPCVALRGDCRRMILDALLGFGGVGLLYAPWLPSLTYQIGQNLQPWGRKADLVWVRDAVAQLLVGTRRSWPSDSERASGWPPWCRDGDGLAPPWAWWCWNCCRLSPLSLAGVGRCGHTGTWP